MIPRVAGLNPSSLQRHVKVSLSQTLNPKLLLMPSSAQVSNLRDFKTITGQLQLWSWSNTDMAVSAHGPGTAGINILNTLMKTLGYFPAIFAPVFVRTKPDIFDKTFLCQHNHVRPYAEHCHKCLHCHHWLLMQTHPMRFKLKVCRWAAFEKSLVILRLLHCMCMLHHTRHPKPPVHSPHCSILYQTSVLPLG